MLYVVATPIGNKLDMTERAIQVLSSVDLVVAEDTRHSLPIFNHFGIKTRLLSMHDHNERERIESLLQRLSAGESIALISDAGTPLISDPGYRLVTEARAAGITVSPIPGCCAIIAALSVAGLPTDKFVFEGFLPAKSVARKQALVAVLEETRTIIFYESKHRIVDSLTAMIDVFGGQRDAVIARELTKRFETIKNGTLSVLLDGLLSSPDHVRGEFVILVKGADNKNKPQLLDENAMHIAKTLRASLSTKQAAELTAKITGLRKKAVYDWLLANKNNE